MLQAPGWVCPPQAMGTAAMTISQPPVRDEKEGLWPTDKMEGNHTIGAGQAPQNGTKSHPPARVVIESSLLKKLLEGHPRVTEAYQCPHCDKAFRYKSRFVTHQTVHRVKTPFECQLCPYKSGRMPHIRAHMLRKHGVGKPLPGGGKCETCGKLCVNRTELARHKATHAKDPRRCEECDKTFMWIKDAKQHVWEEHRSKAEYKCYYCGRGYLRPSHLSAHIRIEHGGVKPFVCVACGKGFLLQEQLNKHTRTHANPKPKFQCEECRIVFNFEEGLKTHLILKHEVESTLQNVRPL